MKRNRKFTFWKQLDKHDMWQRPGLSKEMHHNVRA